MNQIKYDKAKELIQEGDIILFRGSGIIGALFKVSKDIGKPIDYFKKMI